jgi:hypothetical protein
MPLLVMVAVIACVLFGIVIGTAAIPAMVPLLLFSPGQTQVLNGNTAVIGPVPIVAVQSGNRLGGRPSQFALGLNPADAYAACGPTAAIAFGRWFGVELPVTTVMSVASRGLWDATIGMHGVAAEQMMLANLRLSSRLEPVVSWSHVTAEASLGRPVILDTPGHYYFVDAYDPASGRYHVGTSGTDLRGGTEWMSAAQINAMPISRGSVRAAIYADTAAPPKRAGDQE